MQDPFSWLEDVDGERALDWVRERNAETARWLSEDPGQAELQGAIRAVLDAPDQPVLSRRRLDRWYDFRQDAAHPRGLWRRTTLEQLRLRSSPVPSPGNPSSPVPSPGNPSSPGPSPGNPEPDWEPVLDLDELSAAEGVPWVFAGAESLPPTHRRCLVWLSRGGSDAHEAREFDLLDKVWVEGGFRLPEAKSRDTWLDEDTLLLGTDFGPGSMTRSGYPRQVRRWRRGTPLSSAVLVFEGKEDDVQVVPVVDPTPGFRRAFVWQVTSFHQQTVWLLDDEGGATQVPIPASAQLSVWRQWALVRLSEAWEVDGHTWPSGALLAIDFQDLMAGSRALRLVWAPSERTSLESWVSTRHLLVLTVLDEVKARVLVADPERTGWTLRPLPDLPEHASISVDPEEPMDTDVVWVRATDFLTPITNERLDLATGAREAFRGGVARFDASAYAIEQHHATSADGTVVPYFQVALAGLPPSGDHPTLVYGYGGFEISMTPAYSASVGLGWLQRGGVYVVANLRGGGEFGPAWHRAALREKRPRAYEDFEAVVEHLVARGVTRPGRVGALGGSNGGLLVGNLFVRRPELYAGIVCTVPLLDMRRYHRLLAGASWIEEYGDPDQPEVWEYLEKISPYHRVRADGRYPPVLFVTSTRDDRVHPGHARKMVARMLWQGHDVRYWEAIEGGHGAGSTNEQRAFTLAAEYTFLWKVLGDG